MKKTLILIAILLNAIILSSQDREPTAWEFNWGSNSSPRVFEPDSFQQNNFLRGFQWSGTRKMNNALKNNAVAFGNYNDTSTLDVYTPLLMIYQPYWLDITDYTPGFWCAPFMQFEPTLPLTTANFGQILRPADSANPIFGFLERKGTISQNPSDSNYSRLMLYKDSLSTYAPDSIVLQHIYPQPKFRTRDFWGQFKAEGQSDNYLGRKWFLTINLRRLDNKLYPYPIDSPILTIKMPYTLWNGNTGTIRFDSIPIEHRDSVEHWNYFEDRGFAQKMRYDTSRPDSIVITKQMLPINRNYQDITITAEFNTFDYRNYSGNPPFAENTQDQKDTSSIELIDIIVKYYGMLNIAIQDIKIESINAFYLLKGRLDTLNETNNDYPGNRGFITLHTDPEEPPPPAQERIEQPNGIKEIIQSSIDAKKIKTDNWSKAKIFRFYYQDTECDKFYWWGPLRYCNKFSNGMFVTRDWQNYCEIYSYYTKCPNRYLGMKINEHESLLCSPFIGHGDQSVGTFGLKSGFSNFPDSTNSDFETYITNSDSVLLKATVNTDSSYVYYRDVLLDGNDCLQPQWEQATIRCYYENPRYQFLYSDKNWWMNYFVGGAINGDSVNGLFMGAIRQKTGEEIRLLLMNGILMGAKGILMDRESTGKLYGERFTGLGDGTKLNSTYSNLLSDTVGADYFTPTTDDWGLTNWFRDSLYANMKIQNGRLYTGERSTRNSVKDVFNFIKNNEELLMSLRLSAWYGKGYKSWYSQHPRFSSNDTILNRFVNLSNIRTKKLYQPVLDSGYKTQVTYESRDSSFFDITLHSIGTDTLMTKSFVLATQNRRTDPMLYFREYIYDESIGGEELLRNKYHFQFLSTVEFNNLCLNGGKNPLFPYYTDYPDSVWQSYFWRRLGCREINIPFKIGDTSYKMLRVVELTDTSDVFKKPPYYTALDTVVPVNGSISVRFLPGEGKLFKVSDFKEDTPPFLGELAFSNQHKLIAYPVHQTSNKVFSGKDSMVYYHAVYHKRDTIGNNKVYYRRSLLHRPSVYAPIVWEQQEKLISTNLVIKKTIEPQLDADSVVVDTCNCKYPSIVVRFDSVANSQKAYIVYNCQPVQLPDTPKVYIVESVIDSDAPYNEILPDSLIYPIGFAYTNQGNELSNYNWGAPVVNASAEGNYYTWADSIFGIVAGYKTPNDRGFITNKTSIKYYNSINVKSIQPSLNVYSRIANGENDCALVWVEKRQLGLNNLYSTHYTMLKLDGNGNIYNTVPNGILDTNQLRFSSIEYNENGSSQLHNLMNVDIYSYPTVIRPVQYFLRNGYQIQDSVHYASVTWDRVYWESKPPFPSMKVFIYQKMLDIEKNLNKWNCLAPFKIFGLHKSLLNPNVMQGTIRHYDTITRSFHYIVGQDSSFVLGFTTQSDTTGIDTVNSEICMFPHGFWNIYSDQNIEWGNIDTIVDPSHNSNTWTIIRGKGINPQLAKLPIVNQTTDWKINSQIFQSIGNNIYSTRQYFYRKNTEDDPMRTYPMYGFGKKDGSDESIISFFELSNSKMPKIKMLGKKKDKYEYLDTIVTEWFRLENIQELSFISKSSQTSTAKLMIERKKDGKIFDLQPKIFTEKLTSKNRVHLLNGKNEEYRILFAKKDTSYQLNFSFMLAKDSEINPNDELIDADRVGKTAITELESYIDLNNESYDGTIESGIQINIYPNPADEKIYVSAYLPIDYIKSNNNENKILNLSIVNSIGSEIYSGEINAGETKSIETNTYSNGIYFVKISKTGTEFTNQTKMFVIKR